MLLTGRAAISGIAVTVVPAQDTFRYGDYDSPDCSKYHYNILKENPLRRLPTEEGSPE